MTQLPKQKKAGRPSLPLEQRRTGRIAMRTYPDVEEKARRVGTAAVEAAIRKIKEPLMSQKFMMRPIEVVVDEIVQQLEGRKRISPLLMPAEKESDLDEE